MTRPEIAKAARLSDNGALTKYLEELGQCGFVRRYAAFGKRNKDALFQLMDNFTLLHYTFLSATGQTRIRSWAKNVDSHFHSTWEGLAFEHLCLSHLPQMKAALGISGVEADGCSWRGTTPDGQGVQIDLLIDRADRVVNLCEMKWPVCADKRRHRVPVAKTGGPESGGRTRQVDIHHAGDNRRSRP